MSDELLADDEVRIVEMADVAPTRVDWLVSGRIPFGAITVLQGSAGVGKSTIGSDLAARVSSGAQMPFGSEHLAPSGVLILAPEDDLGVVRARLEAAGADLTRIGVYEAGTIAIPDDLDRIEREVTERAVRLIVVDQLDQILARGCSPQSAHGIRRALKGLSSMAARCGIAVLVIRNEVKARNGPALGRGQGSIAIAAAARSVLAVVPHPGDPRLKALVSLKSNLGPKPPALVFRIVPAGDSSAAEWIEEIDLGADDLVGGQGARALTAIGMAHKFLEAQLADGPISIKEVTEAAEAEGIAGPTLRRARREAGVRSFRGRGDDRAWYLALPGVGDPAPGALEGPQGDRGLLCLVAGPPDHPDAAPLPPGSVRLGTDGHDQLGAPEGDTNQGDQLDQVDHLDRDAGGGADAAVVGTVDPAAAHEDVPDARTAADGPHALQVAPEAQPRALPVGTACSYVTSGRTGLLALARRKRSAGSTWGGSGSATVSARAEDDPPVIDPPAERGSTNAVGEDESEHVFASSWGEEMKGQGSAGR